MANQARYKRVIMILADGARPDVLNEELRAGNLPNLARHFAESGTNKTMLTVFPSTTGPAYLPYLTGCYPGTCNVPGIRWFDKPHYAKHGWGFGSFRSYVGLESYLFDRDVAPGIKTAWDAFDRPYNILNVMTKGLARNRDLTRYSRVWHFFHGHQTDKWDGLDALASRFLSRVVKGRDFDYVFAVFPGIDEYSHRTSPFSPRVRRSYGDLDRYVGALVRELKDAGLYDETLITIHSDHGLSETKAHFDIGPWLNDVKKIRTFFYTNIFKFRFDAVSMVSGNGMTHLYFRGEKGWDGRKSFEEISFGSILMDELRHREEIDVVAAQGADGSVHVLTAKGHGSFAPDPVTKKVHYKFDRDDPLGIFMPGDARLNDGFTFDEALAFTFDTHYPDVFQQLWQVFTSPRTGDLVVTAKTGYDLRKRFEHPLHAASHGSLCPEHMLVPLLMNHRIEANHVRSVDVFPTALALTGREIPAGVEGKNRA